MPAGHTDWTIDMLDALPDTDERHEIIDGELFVTPAPRAAHQWVALRFGARLMEFCDRTGIGKVTMSPSDVWRGERKKNRVQPDVFVVDRTAAGLPDYPFHLKSLLLAIEVASPSNPMLDYQVKRTLYLREGVPEYWVVNLDARNVSRWTGRDDPGEVLSRSIAWQPAGAAEPLVIDLPTLFEEALR